MSIFILQDYLTEEEYIWIEQCKSSSMQTGYQLRKAHYNLGTLMGSKICKENLLESKKLAVLILMRAGLPFGLGIADNLEKLGCFVSVHFVYNNVLDETVLGLLSGKTIILVDAVINSGESIRHIVSQLTESARQSVITVTTVIPNDSLKHFKDLNLMAVRVSQNKYKGAKITTIRNGIGPDTGDRLFGTL